MDALHPDAHARADLAREHLQQLAVFLTRSLHLDHSGREAALVARDAMRRHGVPSTATWPALLDDLARQLGMRCSWRAAADATSAPADEVDDRAVAVAWAEEGWLVIDRPSALSFSRSGRCVRVPGGNADARTVKPQAWALLEVGLPADLLRDEHHGPPTTRLVRLLGAEARELRFVALYALAATLLGLATPVTVQVLVNTLALGAPAQPVWFLLAMLAVCLVGAATLGLLQRFIVEIVQRRMFVRLTTDLSLRFPRTRLDMFLRKRGVELIYRFFDVVTVQKALAGLLVDGLDAAISAVVAMALLAMYAPELIGFDLLLLLGLGVVVFYGRGAVPSAVKESKARDAVIGWLQEIVTQPELFKLGGGPSLAATHADQLATDWLDKREKHFKIAFRQYASAVALHVFAHVGLLTLGAQLVMEGSLTIGQLVAAEVVVTSVVLNALKVAGKLESLYDLLAAIEKIGHLVDVPLERDDGLPPTPHRADHTDGMALEVVGLEVVRVPPCPASAPEPAPGRKVLAGLDLQVEPGEHIAILGGPGSGRTTLVEAILGLVDRTHGRIAVDGQDLDDLRLEDLRLQVAVVQGPVWIPGTLADNVLMDRPDLTLAEARDALERVGLRDRLLDLGLDAPILSGGAPLHEGERLRLTLARALAGHPRLLVIDGALDRVPLDEARQLLDLLTAEPAPWTLLLLTRDRALALHLSRALRLDGGRLHPIARLHGGNDR